MSCRRALDVGVLDAKHERAAMPAGVEPVEERSARAADVEIAGRRRRESDARGHDDMLTCSPFDAMAVPFDDVREPMALSRLRTILLWTLVFGAAGMMGELLLIGHDESTAQLVPTPCCSLPDSRRRRAAGFALAGSPQVDADC